MISRIIKFLSYFYVEQFFEMIGVLKRRIKTEYIARRLKKCGKNPRIFFPAIIRGKECIVIGNDFSADKGFFLQCWTEYAGIKYDPTIRIGNNVHVGMECHISAINEIVIGDNLLTGKNLNISDHSHGKVDENDIGVPPIERQLYSKGNVVIGNNVWIGDNVSILPGVKVGNNVVIGANAVVTKDINDNSVVAGIPAKVIKKLEWR